MLRGEYRKGHVRVGDARPVWPGNVMIIYNVIVYNIIRTLELYEELVRAVIANASFPRSPTPMRNLWALFSEQEQFRNRKSHTMSYTYILIL